MYIYCIHCCGIVLFTNAVLIAIYLAHVEIDYLKDPVENRIKMCIDIQSVFTCHMTITDSYNIP